MYLKLKLAATAAEHAHHLFNKEITTSNQIYGIICPRLNTRISAGKPARPRRVIVDSKVGQHTGEHNTIINPTMGNPTTTTKGQQLEMVKTYKYPKRHQGRLREGRGQTPTRRGNTYSLKGRTNHSGTLVKIQ